MKHSHTVSKGHMRKIKRIQKRLNKIITDIIDLSEDVRKDSDTEPIMRPQREQVCNNLIFTATKVSYANCVINTIIDDCQ